MNKSHRVPSNRCLSTVEVKSKVRFRGLASRLCYLLPLGYEPNTYQVAHIGNPVGALTSLVGAHRAHYFDGNGGSVVNVRWLLWRCEPPIAGFVASPSSSHLPGSPTVIQVLVGLRYFGVQAEASQTCSDLQPDSSFILQP